MSFSIWSYAFVCKVFFFSSSSFWPFLTVALLQDVDCMPLNPLENMPASLAKNLVTFDKLFENFNELKMNGWAKDQKQEGHVKFFPGESLEHVDVPCHVPSSTYPMSNLLKQAKVTTSYFDCCLRAYLTGLNFGTPYNGPPIVKRENWHIDLMHVTMYIGHVEDLSFVRRVVSMLSNFTRNIFSLSVVFNISCVHLWVSGVIELSYYKVAMETLQFL